MWLKSLKRTYSICDSKKLRLFNYYGRWLISWSKINFKFSLKKLLITKVIKDHYVKSSKPTAKAAAPKKAAASKKAAAPKKDKD